MQPTGPDYHPTHLAQAAGKLLIDCIEEQLIVDVLAIWYREPRLLQVQKELQACREGHTGLVVYPTQPGFGSGWHHFASGPGGSHSPCTIFSRNAFGFMQICALPAEQSPLHLLRAQASMHHRPQAHPEQQAPAAAPHFVA